MSNFIADLEVVQILKYINIEIKLDQLINVFLYVVCKLVFSTRPKVPGPFDK